MAKIKVYGASWCPDCRRAKRFLGDPVPFEWHDIEAEPEGVQIVQERNSGNNVIPTIIFPDGSHLAEPSNEELADRIVQQAQRYGVEMLQAVSVQSIKSEGDQIDTETATGDHYHSRAVLVATGSSYRRTGVEGEDELIGAGIHFCATCDGPFYKGSKHLLILGGGNSGLEEGLFLTQFTDKVTVIERGDTLKASKLLQDKVMNHRKMEVRTGHVVKEFRKKDDGRELDGRGFIATNDGFATNVPGVLAAGDVRGGSTKQLASAVGEGAGAAIAVRGYLDRLAAA